jgi:hypothetical protein
MPNLISLDALAESGVERNRVMRRVFPMLVHIDNVNKSGQTMQRDWLPLALIAGDIVL